MKVSKKGHLHFFYPPSSPTLSTSSLLFLLHFFCISFTFLLLFFYISPSWLSTSFDVRRTDIGADSERTRRTAEVEAKLKRSWYSIDGNFLKQCSICIVFAFILYI